MAVHRAYLSSIINSAKCFKAINFISKPSQQLPNRYLLNNRIAFHAKAYSTHAVEESESIKNEKGVKIDSQDKETMVSIEEHEKLVEKVKELEEKYKYSIAESVNVRDRMRREIDNAKKFGIQSFVKDLVEVADVLGLAVQSVPKEALADGSVHLKSLFEGLQMTEAQLLTVFKRHGVVQINPVGEKFDTNYHEAVFGIEDSTKEPDTVITVTKVGYKLHDRVVCPAKVGIVKASTS